MKLLRRWSATRYPPRLWTLAEVWRGRDPLPRAEVPSTGQSLVRCATQPTEHSENALVSQGKSAMLRAIQPRLEGERGIAFARGFRRRFWPGRPTHWPLGLRSHPASAAALLAALALSACSTHSPDKPTLTIAISCVPKETPEAPQVHTPEQLSKVPDGPTLFVMTGADYMKLYAWMVQTAPVLEGCRNAAK